MRPCGSAYIMGDFSYTTRRAIKTDLQSPSSRKVVHTLPDFIQRLIFPGQFIH